MKIDVTCVNFQITESVKKHCEKKYSRLANHSSHITYVHVVLKKEKHDFSSEAVINFDSHPNIVAHSNAEDIYVTINRCFDKSQIQLDKAISKDAKHK